MIAVARDLPLSVRPMVQEDVAAVAALEADAYEFPWSPGIFRDCLLAGYTTMVLERDGEVAGYSIMSVAAGEAHLLNICIAPDLRGRGVGRRLLEFMMEQAVLTGARKLFLEVRPSNRRALQVYRRAGFEVIGVRRNYYRAVSGKEDAVVLVRPLPAQGERP